MAAKEHFNFDAFMNKIDTALLLAQKAAYNTDKGDCRAAQKSASATVSKIREIRAMIDEPLVWFKMEKGFRYQKLPGKPWRLKRD